MNLNDDEAVDVIVAVREHAQKLSEQGSKKTASHYKKLLGKLIKRYKKEKG